ncbi:MAG: J domain-containing protein [Polyangiaceae bacterium]
MALVEPEVLQDTRDGALFLVPGVDLREVSAAPAEAFVLACIDGHSSQADIALTTGLSLEAVASIVDSLVARGAVGVAPAQSARQVVAPSTKQSGAYAVASGSPQPRVDLSREQQARLLELEQRSALDHYALLGVQRSAHLTLIRSSYYELVRAFHPDRYYGKQLGSFAGKLLRVFGKLTEAYEVLSRHESRAEYDRYLVAVQRTLEFEQHFNDPNRQSQEVAQALRRIEHVASNEPRAAESVAPSSGLVRRPSGSVVVDPEARRRALARKLGHSSSPPARAPSPSSIPAAPSSSVRAVEDLKHRYEERLARAREEQRAHYVTLSNEAAARSDLVAAANALRVACSLAPASLELAGDLAELERRAAAGMWESYAERGKYAAIEGRPAEAAEAYERAALGHPNASLFERAAFYLLEAQGDVKRAAALAKQAVALAPNSARCRLVLARVYAAAKLRDSALAELERARAIEPGSLVVKEWIQRVKRGDF